MNEEEVIERLNRYKTIKVLYGNNNTFIPVEEFIDINESKTIVKKNNRKSSIKTKKGVPKK